MPVIGKLNDRDAKCPFFASHTRDAITCEGLLPDTHETLHFLRRQDKQVQYNVFCCLRYERCERYQAIMLLYDDRE